MKPKVAVGLSGGVDSALSAALLKKEGYEVVGVYLHCFPKTYQKTLNCTDKEDFKMAQEVAMVLGIPFTFFDFEKDYQKKVINYFFEEYRAGRTPNPDAVCNKEIKFGLFLEKATRELGVDFVATGHYTRIAIEKMAGPVGLHPHPTSSLASLVAGARWGSPTPATRRNYRFSRVTPHFTPNDEPLRPIPYALNPNYHLLAGIDPTKDQSYFLYNLSQKQLSRILFPVGEYTKVQVRQMARDFGLPNWDRKDSQGICFLGKVSVRKFLESRIKPKKGEVVDTSGRVIGEHDGVWFYTIGQRHGFRVDRFSARGPVGLHPRPMSSVEVSTCGCSMGVPRARHPSLSISC
ncbi:MAG: tRNA methyl transferase PRC-barrel domain-containing protein, partial [Dehalococcoidia bacterium]|nr:tRNA methyl transferase PRC-barrel domain-containing protein [Dehalococcoidia bacterium]